VKFKVLTPDDVLNPRPIDPKTGERGEIKLRADGKPKPVWACDGGGLYLVSDQNGRRWFYRYRTSATKREGLGIGGIDATTIEQARRSLKLAREKAEEIRQQRKRDIDPKQAREAAKNAGKAKPTFREIAEEYLASNQAGWSRVHANDTRYGLMHHAAKIANVPVDEIEAEHVLSVLKPIWRTKNITARRLRANIENVLKVAKFKKLRSGENPAAWDGNLEIVLPAVVLEERHHPALDWRRMPELMRWVRSLDDPAARCLEFAILCGNRVGEANGVTWNEIDLEDRLWIIPAARHKAGKRSGKTHVVPLTDRAVALLQSCEGMYTKGPIFPGTKGQRMRSQRTLRMMKKFDPTVTQHGNRAAFKTWAMAHHPAEWLLSEQVLAHTSATKMERGYWRGHDVERVRWLLEAWRAYCDGDAGSRDA
jgi:integrase